MFIGSTAGNFSENPGKNAGRGDSGKKATFFYRREGAKL
jgi:hypothetical protein